MGVPIVLILANALFFSLVATICTVISISSDHWEHLDWDLTKLHQIFTNTSRKTNRLETFGSLRAITVTSPGISATNYSILFGITGGIWKVCDNLDGELRNKLPKLAWNKNGPCFNYIHDYKGQTDQRFTEEARWLIRMENSAASCVIVCIISVIVAKFTGILSIVCKQVAVCTVTAVMYILAACFMVFGLSITHAKLTYYITERGYNLSNDPVVVNPARINTTGWSVAIGWVASVFLILSFIMWAALARSMRIEKSKIII